MQEAININGEILPVDWPVFTAQNRAFRYGDALFETIRVEQGKMPFLPYHYQRLSKGAAALRIQLPKGWNIEMMEEEIRKLEVEEGCFRIRWTCYRNNGGTYTPSDNGSQFIIEKKPLSLETVDVGLLVGLSKEKLIYPHPLSAFKTANSWPYVLGALEKEERGLDELLLQNIAGEIVEAVSSNLFVVMRKKIITQPLSSGVLAGTVRQWILEQKDWKVEEKHITEAKLQRAHGLFLTNAIQGIRWVAGVGNLRYKKLDIIQNIQEKWKAAW